MEKSIFRYVWRHSRSEQVSILLLVALSLPLYFVSLDLPKSIVNKGIQGEGFLGEGSTQPFLDFTLPFSETLTGAPIVLFDGFEMEQPDLLLALSFAFLALVFANGIFKFVINTLKGRMGERMLRRLRYELVDRLLRFPLPYTRRVKQAEVATMIKDEVEPLGGFIGDAFVTPAFLGGQALTAMIFILAQSVWLGLVAAAIVLAQAFVIPRLRRRILVLGRERQITARRLAGRIGELVDGTVEIHANDTSNFERAEITSRLGRIFAIRYEIFQRKFFVKFLNNFMAQLTPFFFYSVGGLLAIGGRLDIGALVAVIAAYKDLPGPVKELIDWDQQRLDVQIKYDQVTEQFQPPDMLDPALQDADADPGPPLDGDLVVNGVTLVDESNAKLLDSVSFTVPMNSHLAVVGAPGGGKEHLGLLLANLMTPTSGNIQIGGRALDGLPQAVTGRRMTYVGPDTYLFPLSLRDNLAYGLKHRPLGEPDRTAQEQKHRAKELAEARRSGNTTLDIEAQWTDFGRAGAADAAELDRRMIDMLSVVDFEEDVYRLGLRGAIDPAARPEAAEAILRARAALTERLAEEGSEDLVVNFDPARYNANATLAENILFGTPRDEAFNTDRLAENALVLDVLRDQALYDQVIAMGDEMARTLVELLGDLPSGHPFFEQFGLMDEDELPEFRALVAKTEKLGLDGLSETDRLLLLRLALKYIEARHRLGLVSDERAAQVVAARRAIAERLAEQAPDAVEFYRPDAYNAAASIQDNVLFGRLAYGQAEAAETVGRAMTETLDGLGLKRTVLTAGLDYQVGVGGKRLTQVQRQKIGLARAVLKEADLMIVSEAAAVMDPPTQRRILSNIIEARAGRGLVWTLQRAAAADQFEHVLVMRAGRIVQQGHFTDLNVPGTDLGRLVATG